MAAEDYFYDEDYGDFEFECRYCGTICFWDLDPDAGDDEDGRYLCDADSGQPHLCQRDKKDDLKCFET